MIRKWLQRLTGSTSRTADRCRQPLRKTATRRKSRPILEVLEDRTAPAVLGSPRVLSSSPAFNIVEPLSFIDFKFDVNLVLLDFAMRHGLVPIDDPEYLTIASGLHRPLD